MVDGPASLQLPADVHVTAAWDEEASVFVGTSTQIPGLVIEAATLDGILARAMARIPELVELNHLQPVTDTVAIHLHTEGTGPLHLRAAG